MVLPMQKADPGIFNLAQMILFPRALRETKMAKQRLRHSVRPPDLGEATSGPNSPKSFTNHTQKLHALTATTSQIVQNNRTRRATQPLSNATSSLPCTSDTPIVTFHEFNSATFPSMDELDRHLSPGHPAER